MVRVREGRKRLSCTHRGQGTNLQWTCFFFLPSAVGSKSYWLYNIPDAHANSRGHTSFKLLLHNARGHIFLNIPFTQFIRHFHWEQLRPVYFRYQVHFLLFSFNQGRTATDALTDVKGVFKSIFNNLLHATQFSREINILSPLTLDFLRLID